MSVSHLRLPGPRWLHSPAPAPLWTWRPAAGPWWRGLKQRTGRWPGLTSWTQVPGWKPGGRKTCESVPETLAALFKMYQTAELCISAVKQEPPVVWILLVGMRMSPVSLRPGELTFNSKMISISGRALACEPLFRTRGNDPVNKRRYIQIRCWPV